MSQQELLRQIVEILDSARIEYMLTGSIVSSLQGEPRSTHDIDIIVAMDHTSMDALIEAFPPPDYYLTRESILNAITHHGMFNLINVNTGDKVDFWLLSNEPFDESRFSRRYIEEFMGLKIQVSAPEDTILAKLRWAKLSGGSEKHFIDALRVYEVQLEKLNIDYMEYWVKELNIASLWERLTSEAKTS